MKTKKAFLIILSSFVCLFGVSTANASCGDPTVYGLTVSATVKTALVSTDRDYAAQVRSAILEFGNTADGQDTADDNVEYVLKITHELYATYDPLTGYTMSLGSSTAASS